MKTRTLPKRRKLGLKPQVERLEERRLLVANNVIAQFRGDLLTTTEQQQIPITIASSDFTLAGAKTVLGFQVERSVGSSLNPAAVRITNSAGANVATRLTVADLVGNSQSLVLAELPIGNYSLFVRGEAGSKGAYQLNVFLAGDNNGDKKVDSVDLLDIRNALGVSQNSPSYRIEADSNLDGVISSFDYTQARDNTNDSTRIRPIESLSISVQPNPLTIAGGLKITNSSSIIVQGSTLPQVSVALETGSDSGFDNGTASSSSGGTFAFPKVSLPDGNNLLRVRAKDGFGQKFESSYSLIVDTQLTSPALDLSAGSDSDIPGDHETSASSVILVGKSDQGARIKLFKNAVEIGSTTAAGDGKFQFAGVTLSMGTNQFVAEASDEAGNVRQFPLSITRVAPTSTGEDVVLHWNHIALDAIRVDASTPPVASRALAMVGTAIYDAVSAIDGTPGYMVKLSPTSGSSPVAAAAAAAHRVLSYLYPGQKAELDQQLNDSLQVISSASAVLNGVQFGQSIADAIIALRKDDGSRNFTDYIPKDSNAGTWQTTAPTYTEALLPNWATLTPFSLDSPDQFRPTAPPALGSPEYAAALNEVKAKGSATNSTRTSDETQIALFWADGLGTVTPPGHWNRIALDLAASSGFSLSANARLFAQLNVALADAAIAAWDAKYAYGLWRPITAIQNAADDTNSQTTADPSWTPLLVTPNFPTYTSGHSTFSGAAQTVLESYFGTSTSFTVTTEAVQIAPRTYSSFAQAAAEAGQSRIYGGIHFQFDNQAGLVAGRNVAKHVLDDFSFTNDDRAPEVNVDQANLMVSSSNLSVTGQVIDNLSGVKTLSVQIDNGSFVALSFNNNGFFSVPTSFPLNGTAEGTHYLRFKSTDYAGNTSSVTEFAFVLDTLAPTIQVSVPTQSSELTGASRIQGVVSGTGSAITELNYTLDSGDSFSLTFDGTTGIFDDAINLAKLQAGTHTLQVSARDAAGHQSVQTIDVVLTEAIPLNILTVSPAPNSLDAGTTEKPKIVFSRPINPDTIGAGNFYATDPSGEKLLAHIVIADDALSAYLFFDQPVPGASVITITVDGSTIVASDGTKLDAGNTKEPGSKLVYSYSTVSLAGLEGTQLVGTLADPGADLKPGTIDDVRRGPDGVLMTGDDVYLHPIANVHVYILGMEEFGVYTDDQGKFTLTSVPSGSVKLVVDGLTANNAPQGFYFPEMVMELDVEPSRINTVMGSMGSRQQAAAAEEIKGVYLPRLRSAILQDVSDVTPTLIQVAPESAPDLTDEQRSFLTATVQPGTAIGPLGEVLTDVQMGISTVPPELIRDMLPPGVSEPQFTITVQAPGVVTFTTPVTLSYPNVDNAPPGTKLVFISFNHATGRLEIDGTATVSADGKSVVTDPDSGIIHPGWHFVIQGSPGLFKVGTLKPVPDPLGGGADFFHSDRLFPKIDAAINDLFTGAINDLISNIPFLDPIANPIDVSPFKTAIHNAIRACYIGGGAVKGADSNIVSRYYERFLSGVGGRFQGEADITDLVKNEPKVKSELSRLKGILEPAINKAVEDSIDKENGVLDLNLVRSALESSLSSLVLTPPLLASNGTLLLVVDNTEEVKLEVNNLRATGTITSPEVGGTGTWNADMVYTASDDFGFDPADIERTFKFALQDAEAALVATAKASFYAALALDDLKNLRLEDALTHAREAIKQAEIAASKAKSAVVNIVGGSCVSLFALEQGHGYAEPFITDFKVENTPDTKLTGNFDIPPGFEDVIVKQSAPKGGKSLLSAPGKFGVDTVSIDIPMSTATGFGNSGRVYYRMLSESGLAIAGILNQGQTVSNIVLPPNQKFTATFYAPDTNSSLEISGKSSASGVPTFIGKDGLDSSSTPGLLEMTTVGGIDRDRDGLPDQGEYAIGTRADVADSDGDGIIDSVEIEQGLDPLAGRAFPTGVIAALPLNGYPEKIAVDGERIFVATGDFGMAAIDGSRFNAPIVLGQIDLPGYAMDIAVDGNLGIAAVATTSGLALVDIRSRTELKLIRSVNISSSKVLVANGLAYVGANDGTLSVVDLSTGSVLQSMSLSGFGSLTGWAREGSFLYAFMSGSDTFSVIDISNEGSAFQRGTIEVDVASFDVGLFVGNGVAWLSGSGLRTLNVSNPDFPSIIQTPTGNEFFNARRIALNGSGLGLLLPDSGDFVQVYSTSNPSNVSDLLLQVQLQGAARDVAISRGVAYIATSQGLEVVNYLPFDNLGIAPTVTTTTTENDQDPNTPGIQVVEGKTIPIRVSVTDDVQVRSAELLVNGVVVRTDVAFPFDFFTSVPSISQSGTQFTVQTRVTDTGGNQKLSNVLVFQLVADTFAPTIVGFVPPTNASVVEPIQIVQVRFSEPMDAATLSLKDIEVLNDGNVVQTPTSFQLRDDDRLIQIIYPALLAGNYRIVVSGGVRDRAGNQLGSSVTSLFTLTPRAELLTTSVDADPQNPGFQLFESTLVPLTVNVVPGVTVQKVELLVDGQVAFVDQSAPYQFNYLVPNTTAGNHSVKLVARVTDTNGLATFTSPEMVIDILEDVIAPTVTGSNPAQGGSGFEGLTELQVYFSELIAAASVSASNFRLFRAGPNGFDGTETEEPILSATLLENMTTANITTASLVKGSYRLILNGASITDLALNNFGATPLSIDFVLQEQLLTNASFETGDFTAWTVNSASFGSAVVLPSWQSQPSDETSFAPVHGSKFAVLRTGSAGQYERISQTFTAQVGDVIAGSTFFDTSDYLPFTDNGYVRIYSSTNTIVTTLFSASIATVGSYSQTPWTRWQYTFSTAGIYRIEAGVANGGDSSVDSYLGLDDLQLYHGAVPPPVNQSIAFASNLNSVAATSQLAVSQKTSQVDAVLSTISDGWQPTSNTMESIPLPPNSTDIDLDLKKLKQKSLDEYFSELGQF